MKNVEEKRQYFRNFDDTEMLLVEKTNMLHNNVFVFAGFLDLITLSKTIASHFLCNWPSVPELQPWTIVHNPLKDLLSLVRIHYFLWIPLY